MVYLLTTGDGSDGDSWCVEGIYSTREKADAAKVAYESYQITRPNGSTYTRFANDIEEWPLDTPPN